jgi:hypothetical protein
MYALGHRSADRRLLGLMQDDFTGRGGPRRNGYGATVRARHDALGFKLVQVASDGRGVDSKILRQRVDTLKSALMQKIDDVRAT